MNRKHTLHFLTLNGFLQRAAETYSDLFNNWTYVLMVYYIGKIIVSCESIHQICTAVVISFPPLFYICSIILSNGGLFCKNNKEFMQRRKVIAHQMLAYICTYIYKYIRGGNRFWYLARFHTIAHVSNIHEYKWRALKSHQPYVFPYPHVYVSPLNKSLCNVNSFFLYIVCSLCCWRTC